jgi:ubiquinone/menaquinone biosynthesis C-methylase UbiE
MSSSFWNAVYNSKTENDVSWFQEVPTRSLELIAELNLPLASKIIDIGGGDSKLVDHLLKIGFSDISVLDISEVSLAKAKQRLGINADKVSFIASDVITFEPSQKYDLWHDRATFHFLTAVDQIERYLEIAANALSPEGHLIISTFSKNGPGKCSGLTVNQYSDEELKTLFKKYFINIKCFEDIHETPWGAKQNFVYCGFRKI